MPALHCEMQAQWNNKQLCFYDDECFWLCGCWIWIQNSKRLKKLRLFQGLTQILMFSDDILDSSQVFVYLSTWFRACFLINCFKVNPLLNYIFTSIFACGSCGSKSASLSPSPSAVPRLRTQLCGREAAFLLIRADQALLLRQELVDWKPCYCLHLIKTAQHVACEQQKELEDSECVQPWHVVSSRDILKG